MSYGVSKVGKEITKGRKIMWFVRKASQVKTKGCWVYAKYRPPVHGPLQNGLPLWTIPNFLRWLDWIFLGGYLPSLSLNYVGMSKDIEKRLPQLYHIKMKISWDLGFIAIGVAMATDFKNPQKDFINLHSAAFHTVFGGNLVHA